jgi:threonine/homoserine/homoserine lactone efflux protein
MPDPSIILIFVMATMALLIVPGPAVVYIVTRSLAQGRTAGLLSVLGIHAGTVVHVFAATIGITALLAASPTAFTVVQYLGAAYLVYLGVQKLRRRGDDERPARPVIESNARLFGQGVLVNVLNPKTAVFFLAFIPQFVAPERGPVPVQMMIFGLGFILLGILSDGSYALLASMLSGRLRRTATARRVLDKTSGVIYLLLAVVAVVLGTVSRPD